MERGISSDSASRAVVVIGSTLRAAPRPCDRAAAAGLAAGLLAHFAFSLTDAIPLGAKVGVLFWLTLALTVSVHRAACARPAYSENPAAAASS